MIKAKQSQANKARETKQRKPKAWSKHGQGMIKAKASNDQIVMKSWPTFSSELTFFMNEQSKTEARSKPNKAKQRQAKANKAKPS